MSHDRRTILHVNVPDHPTAKWTTQQIAEAFPWDAVPRFLLGDRDQICGRYFRQRVGNMGIEEVRAALSSPWQNPYMRSAGAHTLRATAALALAVAVVQAHISAQDAEGRKMAPFTLSRPADRPDRLVEVRGTRSQPLLAQYSTDAGRTWLRATMYLGATTDDWCTQKGALWNAAARDGLIPAGTQPCVWNLFIDLDLPCRDVRFRLVQRSGGDAVFEQPLGVADIENVVLVNARNARDLARPQWPTGWALESAGIKAPARASLHAAIPRKRHQIAGARAYRYELLAPIPPALELDPGVNGWHRLYVAMAPYSSFEISLSGDDVRYAVPNYYRNSGSSRRLLQEFYVASADFTRQRLVLRPGGTRFWRDVSVRHLRLVPMSAAEIDRFHQVRDLARREGRPFAGYLEPCTPAGYEPASLTLRQHVRNEMRLNREYGSTSVYVHVIRIGCVAWYHSDVAERDCREGQNYVAWMREQGDPLAVAVEEARAAGLRIFADAGMNATYYGKTGHYGDMTGRFAREHPGLLCKDYPICFDYRQPEVQRFVVAVVRELMTKYDVDGVNLDFARFGYRGAYDLASLVSALTGIQRSRRDAEQRWGHPVAVSVRVPYDAPPGTGAPAPVFVAALAQWARGGLIDRALVEPPKGDPAAANLGHYLAAVRGSGTRLWGDMYWGTWPKSGGPSRDLRIARDWVKQGLDGGLFYYMRARPVEWGCINWQMRLIDRPDVKVDPHHVRDGDFRG